MQPACLVCAGGFLAVGIWSVVAILGGSFEYPTACAIVCGGFWTAWLLVSVAWAVYYGRLRLCLNEKGIERVAPFSRRCFRWEDIGGLLIQRDEGLRYSKLILKTRGGTEWTLYPAEYPSRGEARIAAFLSALPEHARPSFKVMTLRGWERSVVRDVVKLAYSLLLLTSAMFIARLVAGYFGGYG